MKVPEELSYTKEHEWVRAMDNEATIGITDFAQSQLGDIIFLELPEIGLRYEVLLHFIDNEISINKSILDYTPIIPFDDSIN